jgi:hypothetical protein
MVYRNNIFIPFLYEHEVVSHKVLVTLGELSFLYFHKWNILYVLNNDIKNLCSLSTAYVSENKQRLFSYTALNAWSY